MKPKALFVVAVALLPVAVWSVSKEMTGRAWLQQVPPLPDSATNAYAQWVDDNGDLQPGAGFKAVEDGLTNVAKDQAAAAMTSPQMQQQQAMAQQFSSPEAQARLRSMSPAELMAMAQQFQPPPMAGGPVSSHDQVLMRSIGAYPGTMQVQGDIEKVRQAAIALEQQWQSEREGLDHQESQARNALPVCHDEAGEPFGIAVRDLSLKYADQRIALANRYLPKMQGLVQQMRTAVQPRIDYGDSAMAAWAQLDSPSLKQQTAAVARGAQNSGLGDIGLVQSLVEDFSRRGAQPVADRKNIERVYADAKGC